MPKGPKRAPSHEGDMWGLHTVQDGFSAAGDLPFCPCPQAHDTNHARRSSRLAPGAAAQRQQHDAARPQERGHDQWRHR